MNASSSGSRSTLSGYVRALTKQPTDKRQELARSIAAQLTESMVRLNNEDRRKEVEKLLF